MYGTTYLSGTRIRRASFSFFLLLKKSIQRRMNKSTRGESEAEAWVWHFLLICFILTRRYSEHLELQDTFLIEQKKNINCKFVDT